jgi:hypothetical protein
MSIKLLELGHGLRLGGCHYGADVENVEEWSLVVMVENKWT